MTAPRRIVGVDTGGTFTDFVLMEEGELRIHKVPSTPENPARAVLAGLADLLGEGGAAGSAELVHGSTVATNALLERKGAAVALVTTAGFEDVIQIGRQTRGAIYDLSVGKAPALVPPDRRIGVEERVGPRGEILTALTPAEIEGAVDRLESTGAEAVAICLLHAYADGSHERRLAEAIEARSGLFVSSSHEVLPEFREYERCSTTVVNSYVGPVVSRYLSELSGAVGSERVRIMQSNGGVISLEAAGRLAVQTVLSGPAGGAVGGFEIGRRAGHDDVITFDMGGTSTDVSLCPGALGRTTEAIIGEVPIRLPVIDVHTVGAGGGSVAYRDPGGSLKVGPRSAGADPGPICYGRGGEEVTVTDANLYLGRLSADHFLGGDQALEVEPARSAIERLAADFRLAPIEAAEGVIRVANAIMERAIRVISLERGHDPRDFTLVCFGGAGAMHAAELAAGLGIPRVLVPRGAGTLSALGMLLADVVRDFSRTLLVAADELDAEELEEAFGRLERRAYTAFEAEGFAAGALRIERSLELRYVGQGYELSVPAVADFETAFHERHAARYGYSDPGRPIEIVNLRLRAVGATPKPDLEAREPVDADPSDATLGEHRMAFDGAERTGVLVDRARLAPGHAFAGPALVVEYSTTTVVPPGTRCSVDRWENLLLEPA